MPEYTARQDCRSRHNNGIFTGDNPDPQGNQNQWAIYHNGYRVALIEEAYGNRTQEQVDFEARLFAAASDMLAILQWWIDQMNDDDCDDMRELLDTMTRKAHAIRTKVEGYG